MAITISNSSEEVKFNIGNVGSIVYFVGCYA